MSKVILRADVQGLGKRGDIIEVADGHARNFLIPRKLAMPAAAGTVAQAASMRRARDLRDAKDRASAETVAKTLVAKTITIAMKSHGEKLFGSVTSSDVVAAIEAQTGVVVDRRKVHMSDHIKSLGSHSVPVKLHSDVEFAVTVEVVPV
jgi:large subunit ribosomal protein L9